MLNQHHRVAERSLDAIVGGLHVGVTRSTSHKRHCASR
jgi:hypothetical protein